MIQYNVSQSRSGTVGEFLDSLIEKAKEFNWSDIDWSSVVHTALDESGIKELTEEMLYWIKVLVQPGFAAGEAYDWTTGKIREGWSELTR